MKFNSNRRRTNFLAIKIPAACMYVQEFLNDRAIDVALADIF